MAQGWPESTGLTFEASGAQEFHKLQLGLFSKMANTPEILKKEKSEKLQNDDISALMHLKMFR